MWSRNARLGAYLYASSSLCQCLVPMRRTSLILLFSLGSSIAVPHEQCRWSWKALVQKPFKLEVLGCTPKQHCRAHLHPWCKCWPVTDQSTHVTKADAQTEVDEVDIAAAGGIALLVELTRSGTAVAKERAAAALATMAYHDGDDQAATKRDDGKPWNTSYWELG